MALVVFLNAVLSGIQTVRAGRVGRKTAGQLQDAIDEAIRRQDDRIEKRRQRMDGTGVDTAGQMTSVAGSMAGKSFRRR